MNYAPQSDQTHEDPSIAAPARAQEERELTPAHERVLRIVADMEPKEAKNLVGMIQRYPEIRDQIIAAAQQAIGNEAVARALQSAAGQPARGAPLSGTSVLEEMEVEGNPKAAAPQPAHGTPLTGTSVLEEMELEGNPRAAQPTRGAPLSGTSVLEEMELEGNPRAAQPTRGAPLTGTSVLEEMELEGNPRAAQPTHGTPLTGTSVLEEMELEGNPKANAPLPTHGTPLTGTSVLEEMELEGNPKEAAGPAAKEAAWVTGARAYNRRHSALVAEFNQLTSNVCAGPDGEIDPNLVSDWQQDHGVPPDGRVGERTVEAAREGGAKRSTDSVQTAVTEDVREAPPAIERTEQPEYA